MQLNIFLDTITRESPKKILKRQFGICKDIWRPLLKTLDLHNVRRNKVEEKLIKFVNHRLPLDLPFRIIIGKSKHTHTLVIQLLEKNELYWKYENYTNTDSIIIMDEPLKVKEN